MYRLRVTVHEIRGFCDLPMKVGDYFEIDGSKLLVPPGKHVCIWALSAMIPFLTAKQRNVQEENDWLPTTSLIGCPDPNGMVIYRVETLEHMGGDLPEQQQSRDGAAQNAGATRAMGTHGAQAASCNPKMQAGEAPSRLLVSQSDCTGCRRCELACGYHHESAYWPEMSRIRVSKDEPSGIDAPEVCRQCGTARCVASCPNGALSRDPWTRAVVLNKNLCTRCLRCKEVCAFSAVHVDNQGYPLICDLCGGSPQCVEVCPTGAVRYGRAGSTMIEPRFKQPGKEEPVKLQDEAGKHVEA